MLLQSTLLECEYFLMLGITKVTVKSRGTKSRNFSRLIENIRNFSARDTQCVLGVSLRVGRDNHQHIFEVSTLLKDYGVNYVKASDAVVSNNAARNNAYHLAIKVEVARQIAMAQTVADERLLCSTTITIWRIGLRSITTQAHCYDL